MISAQAKLQARKATGLTIGEERALMEKMANLHTHIRGLRSDARWTRQNTPPHMPEELDRLRESLRVAMYSLRRTRRNLAGR